jgi:hypothetical protein
VFDRHHRIFFNSIDDLADDNRNAAVAAITNMRLKRFAPAPVEQAVGRDNACSRWGGLLADDPGKRLDA